MKREIPRGPVTDTILYTSPPLDDVAELRRRVRAAGFAHIARIAVDGGPVEAPKPIRRRMTLNMAALIGFWLGALGVLIVLSWVLS